MKRLYAIAALFSLHLCALSAAGQKSTFVNPAGTYQFSGRSMKRGGDIYGYFGHAKVLLVDSNKILMSFFICKGAPSYNSGSFIDTLPYVNNQAVYRGDSVSDPTCRLTMDFSRKGLDVRLFSDNRNFACGFGHAVDAYGFFRKKKGPLPTEKDILEDGQ